MKQQTEFEKLLLPCIQINLQLVEGIHKGYFRRAIAEASLERRNLELSEKRRFHRVVVMLPRVDEMHRNPGLPKRRHDGSDLHEIGACAHDRND